MLGPKYCRPSGTWWGKTHGHGARQLKPSLSSGPDEAKKEDVSRSEEMISRSIGLWPALPTVEIFKEFQNKFIPKSIAEYSPKSF